MKEPVGGQGENTILFCTRPWRVMGAVVAGLVALTFIWGGVILGTYRYDERFDNERDLSVTEFLSRNIALPGSISLPDAIAPAVVAIDGGMVNGGDVASGAIVGANGYVLTTLHAVETLTDIKVRVRTASGIRAFGAQIVKKAPSHDLVMLKIKSPGSFLFLSLADTGAGFGGAPVFAFGQGANGNLVVRQGGVSAQPVPLSVEGLTISHLRTTDAVYSWEQSGGPVVNGEGALIGITLAVQDRSGVIRGYVVPADVISAHFRDVVNFKAAAPSAASSPAVAPMMAPPAAGPSAIRSPMALATPGAGVLPRAVEAALPAVATGMFLPGLDFAPPAEAPKAAGASGWWLRAANRVGAPGQPLGLNAVANGPPAGLPGGTVETAAPVPAASADHLLGMRFAGFAVEDLIGLTLLALAKGVIGGMMTMGGGVFLVAGMMMFFGYGLFLIRPVAYLTNIFVYSASSMRHYRNGLMQVETIKSLAPWAVIGVILGYFIGNSIGDRLVEILLGIFAVLISVKAAHEVLVSETDEIILDGNGQPVRGPDAEGSTVDELEDPRPEREATGSILALAKPALLALPMGIMSGILGITGGVVEVPLQHYIGKVPLKNAIANSAALVFCASLTGTVLAFVHGTATGLIDWQAPLALAAVLIPASFAGGVVGAHLTKLAPKRPLKAIFSVLMLAVAIRMFIGH